MNLTRATVKRDDIFNYTNKFMRKEVQFQPAADEVVATFNEDQADDAAELLFRRETSSVVAARADRGFAILRLGDEETFEATDADLAGQENIANVLPVMIDEEGNRRYFLPDEFTVQFTGDVAPERSQEILDEMGCQVVVQQRTPGYFTVAVPEGAGLFETLRDVTEMEEVAFAEPSEIGLNDELDEMIVDPTIQEFDFDLLAGEPGPPEPLLPELMDQEAEEQPEAFDELALPSDTHFGRLWGLHNIGQAVEGNVGLADADIDAPQAWTITKGSPKVIVAVIDTGADLDHPDLAPNLFPQSSEDWDFGDPNDDVPWDSGSHGTHVAGTAVAKQNSHGVIGVAPDCRLMPLRVNLTSGMNANRADAINYVAAQAQAHPDLRFVINCSWKMSGDHAGVHNAIRNAVVANVVVVFAAGNAYRNIDIQPQYPAVYPEVIAVAALNNNDQKPAFSNWGNAVDVSAPGEEIYSCVPNDTYGYKSGTSMAAPHVAGVAALVRSLNRDLNAAHVRSIIESTCDNVDARNPGITGLLGTGRVNAYRALRATPPTPIRFRVRQRIPFPQTNSGSSTGLSFASRFPRRWFGSTPALVFLTQKAYSEKVYFMHPWSGAVIHTVDPANNDTIGSLAWDGWTLWVANVTTGAGSINRIHPFSGAQLGSIPAPPGRGEGLAKIGSWIFYSTVNQIHVIRASTGAVIRTFPAPNGECRSLAANGGWLFCGDSTGGMVTVMHPWTLAVRGTIHVPGGGNRRVEGLAYDKYRRTLYVANQSENMIYALTLSL